MSFNFTGLSASLSPMRRDLRLRQGGELLPKREPGGAARPRDTSYLGELSARPPPPPTCLSPRAPPSPRGGALASPRIAADADASPRALPPSRADVRALAARLDAELAAAANQLMLGGTMAAAARAARERAWRSAHAELVAQVRVHCAERGALLERAHAALVSAADEREALVRTLASKHGEAAVVRELRAELEEARAALDAARAHARREFDDASAEPREPAREPGGPRAPPPPPPPLALGAQLELLLAAPARGEPPGCVVASAPAEGVARSPARASPAPNGRRSRRSRRGATSAAAAAAAAANAAAPPLSLVALAEAVAQGQRGRAELRDQIAAALARLGSPADRFSIVVELAVAASAQADAPRDAPRDAPTTVDGDGVAREGLASPRRAQPAPLVVAAPAPREPDANAGASALKMARAHGDAAVARVRAVGALVERALLPAEREALLGFLAARAAPLERRALLESAFHAVGAERPSRELLELLEPLFWLVGEHRWPAALCGLYDVLPARAKLAALRQLAPRLGADGREELELHVLPPPPPGLDASAQTDGERDDGGGGASSTGELAGGADAAGGGGSPRARPALRPRAPSAGLVIDAVSGALSPRAGPLSGGSADGGAGARWRVAVRRPSALAIVEGGGSPRTLAPSTTPWRAAAAGGAAVARGRSLSLASVRVPGA